MGKKFVVYFVTPDGDVMVPVLTKEGLPASFAFYQDAWLWMWRELISRLGYDWNEVGIRSL